MNGYPRSVAGPTIRLALVLCALASSLRAQQPGSPGQPAASSQLPPYRPPALALVQPAAGGSVPEDKPVVVFRFAPGEPNDPIDARTFAVALDGMDRTAQFHITAGEAWGSLAHEPDEAGLSRGAHQLSARICSARGACVEVSATVSVIEGSPAVGEPPEPAADARRRKVLDAVITAIRKLLEL